MAENQGCLTQILRLFGLGSRIEELTQPRLQPLQSEPTQPLPYKVSDRFVSPAELSFYHVLKAALGEQVVVFAKVGLGDLFFVTKPYRSPEYQRFRNRIAQRHVDFVLCDPQSMHPLLGIELDDSSHQRADRVKRDHFVDQVFDAAKLPLLHVPVRPTYNTEKVRVAVERRLASAPVIHHQVSSQVSSNEVPLCPKCGIPMMLRTASRGKRAGEQFYGCEHYPDCREVIPITERASFSDAPTV